MQEILDIILLQQKLQVSINLTFLCSSEELHFFFGAVF